MLPSLLQGWIDISPNPTRQPSPKPSILKATDFDEDARRVAMFNGYVEALKNWNRSQIGKKPDLPEILSGWVDEETGDRSPIPISRREVEEKFEEKTRAFSWQVVDKLKLGRKIPHWLRNEMMKIWKTAIKKGFKPKI
jgi:hypothetical protein